MDSSLEKLITDIQNGASLPCYLICGTDEFNVKNAAERIIAAFGSFPDADLRYFIYDGESADEGDIAGALQTTSLIPGPKIISVRNTRLFQSPSPARTSIADIIEALETDEKMAARLFMMFLESAGWTLDDMKDDGWRRITDRAWATAADDATGTDRSTWIPRALDAVLTYDMAPGSAPGRGNGAVERALKEGLPTGNHLVITAETVDKRKALYKMIAEAGAVLVYEQPKVEGKKKALARNTVRDVLSARGKTMAPDAFEAFCEKTGLSLPLVMAELEKLVTYTGEKKTIEVEDICAAAGGDGEATIFDLTNAIGCRNATAALAAVRFLADRNVSPLFILSMVTREVRHLLQAKILLASQCQGIFSPGMTYGHFRERVYPAVTQCRPPSGGKEGWLWGQHPYPVYAVFKEAHRFTLDDLVAALERVAETDAALKTSAADPFHLIRRLVIDLCRQAA